MFLVGKRDVTIKARTCADGIKHRRGDSYKNKYYASTNFANNSVMNTDILEAKEGSDVYIIGRVTSQDVPANLILWYIAKTITTLL